MSAKGPYVAVAALCDAVLDEKDERVSCIRFLDRIDVTLPPDAPDNVGVPLHVTGLVSLKSGDFKGKKTIKVNLVYPDGGVRQSPEEFPAVFEGEERGINVILRFTLLTHAAGLYSFDVLLDGEMVTRIPFRVTLTRTQPDASQPANSAKAQPPEAD